MTGAVKRTVDPTDEENDEEPNSKQIPGQTGVTGTNTTTYTDVAGTAEVDKKLNKDNKKKNRKHKNKSKEHDKSQQPSNASGVYV